MKRIILLFLFLTACSSTSSKLSSGFQGEKFKLRPMRTVKLPNGLKIFFIEDATLPRVSLSMLVRVGTLNEPEELAGLNAFTAMMLEQGTKKRPAMELAEEFGQLGTEMSASPGSDFTFVSVDALSKDKEKVLDLFADVVRNPVFNVSEINRIRSRLKAQIQKKIDNPSSYTDDEFDKLLFGHHPYGRDVMGTVEGVEKIEKADLIKHYLNWYRPNNSSMAVVGQLTPEFEKNVVEAFKAWSSRSANPDALASLPQVDKLQVQLLSKAGLKQAQIRLGRPGVQRKNEDFLVLRATSEILGGSGASRLMQRVRDDLGLTYGVYSAFDFRKDNGSFYITTFTKNESVGQTLKEVLEVYNKFAEQGVTEKELRAAKAQMIGQFPRAVETADLFSYNILVLDFYDIPFTYLENYIGAVNDISVSDVNNVIKKYLPANQLTVLVYGDEKQVLKQLSSYGPQIVRVKKNN